MKKVLLILLLCLTVFAPTLSKSEFNIDPFTPACLNMDIIIIGDYSGSVQGNEPFLIRSFQVLINNLLTMPEDDIHLGLILFNDLAEVICPLTADKDIAHKSLSYISDRSNGSTFLTNALYSSFDELTTNGRSGYKKIIIIISDGDVHDVDESILAVNQLKSIGIQVYSILINTNVANKEFMESISSPNCYFETDYFNLAKTIVNLNLCL